jgi:hypothetical protein
MAHVSAHGTEPWILIKTQDIWTVSATIRKGHTMELVIEIRLRTGATPLPQIQLKFDNPLWSDTKEENVLLKDYKTQGPNYN